MAANLPQDISSLQAEINRLQLELKSLKSDKLDGATSKTHGVNDGEMISVGNYLLARLDQLGVRSMFGVPGDFNLGFLDLVEDHPNIDWIGNCNELNAAYAADGYARVKKHGLGVVLTTFGVGELSAMNGIAGAFSEMVPVLHVVGVPNLKQQKTKPMLHHTLGDGRFDAYYKASSHFTIAQADLREKNTAAQQIDEVITQCITKARPAYLTLPTDLAYTLIPSGRLSTPLTRLPTPNDTQTEKFVLDSIVKLCEDSKGDAIVLVDAGTIRHDVREEVKELVRAWKVPVYSAPMGKSALDESEEGYGGIYVGSITHEDIKQHVESTKLILSVGALKSDFNTGNFTYSIPTDRTIELHSDHTNVQFSHYPGIGMKQLLPKITQRISKLPKHGARAYASTKFTHEVPEVDDGEVISHKWFWPKMGKFFREKDVVVAETGTSSFGVLDVPLPKQAVFVSQILWGSIGWTVGSTLGAALAAREEGLGRTILFIGDGSLQLTVQELSSMIRHGLHPIIFVLNNCGYTIERHLHGKDRKYNDIENWSWTSLLRTLGDLDGTRSESYTVRSKDELSALLANEDGFANAKKIRLVEVIMDRLDAPKALLVQAELSGKTNAYSVDTGAMTDRKPADLDGV
jgi:pyruvate decarboxylase